MLSALFFCKLLKKIGIYSFKFFKGTIKHEKIGRNLTCTAQHRSLSGGLHSVCSNDMTFRKSHNSGGSKNISARQGQWGMEGRMGRGGTGEF